MHKAIGNTPAHSQISGNTHLGMSNPAVNQTQQDRLLARLRHGPVNPLQAWKELGIYRLGARVFDLRRAGHDITKKHVTVKNRYGEPCRVAEYRLQEVKGE